MFSPEQLSVTDQKKALRKSMFAARNQADSDARQQYDQWICERLLHIIRSRNCKTVHAYIPIFTEINIRPLLETLLSEGITVVAPKTLPKRQLENRILRSFESLETGIMGTLHPADPEVHSGTYDLIIVPGLAVDEQRYRLGYGGGYYDNFLVQHPDAYKVGIYYPFQLVSEVPREPHDVQLDEVLVGEM